MQKRNWLNAWTIFISPVIFLFCIALFIRFGSWVGASFSLLEPFIYFLGTCIFAREGLFLIIFIYALFPVCALFALAYYSFITNVKKMNTKRKWFQIIFNVILTVIYFVIGHFLVTGFVAAMSVNRTDRVDGKSGRSNINNVIVYSTNLRSSLII